MDQLILVHDSMNGNPIYINPAYIVSISRYEQAGHTEIVLAHCPIKWHNVRETAEQIISGVQDKQRKAY